MSTGEGREDRVCEQLRRRHALAAECCRSVCRCVLVCARGMGLVHSRCLHTRTSMRCACVLLVSESVVAIARGGESGCGSAVTVLREGWTRYGGEWRVGAQRGAVRLVRALR